MQYMIDPHVVIDEFLTLTNSIWPGEYDRDKIGEALTKTINITARENGRLVGCLRILTDGYFFSTIPEVFVLPEYQGQGIGTKLLEMAKEVTPSFLFFGAQPEKVDFYEKRGFEKSVQSFHYKKPRKYE